MEKLSEEEIDFILEALQQVYVDAFQKLMGRQLGDIERQNYEYVKKQSKELMIKLDAIKQET